MKFNCGPEYKPLTEKELLQLEKWKKSADAWRAKRVHKTVWHRWFAWYPVRIDQRSCIWLEWVERRLEYTSGTHPFVWQRDYRSIPCLS